MATATQNMPPKKPSRTFVPAKVSVRTLQLAKIICAYESNMSMGDLISDTCESAFIKIIERKGLVLPPDPDKDRK